MTILNLDQSEPTWFNVVRVLVQRAAIAAGRSFESRHPSNGWFHTWISQCDSRRVIEIEREMNAARAIAVTTELVEISDRPLDPALFEVPAGYRPALPRWSGDFDITRPDTLANRLWFLWESASELVQRIWR